MFRQVGYFRRKRILREANFLDLKPIGKFEHKEGTNGGIVVLIPRFRGWLGKHLLQPRLKYPYITLELDALGADTWLLSDGKNTVRQICQLLRQKHAEKIEPAEDRITTFLSGLYMQKLITFTEILKP